VILLGKLAYLFEEYCRELLQAAIQQHPTAFGFIIEGYPRNISQALEMEKVINVYAILSSFER